MPQIPNVNCNFAPSVANASGKVAVVWAQNNANTTINLAVYSIENSNWSAPQSLLTMTTEGRAAVAFWNGCYYVVYQGLGSSGNWWTITDLATIPNRAWPLVGVTTTGWPSIFPYGQSLIINDTTVAQQPVSTIASYAASANWLLTNSGEFIQTEPAITTPAPCQLGAQMAAMPTTEGGLYCTVYGAASGSSSTLNWVSCINQQWSGSNTASGNIASSTMISFPSLTVYNKTFYAAWVDFKLGVCFSQGTPQKGSPNIAWSQPNVVSSVPSGVTDVTISSGPDGIFLAYTVPSVNNAGFVVLTPSVVSAA